MPVHKICICCAGYIRNIGWTHVHASPWKPLRYGWAEAVLCRGGDKIREREPVVVVVVALCFQVAEDSFRISIRPVRKQHHVLSVELNRIVIDRIDNYRTDQPGLLLKPAVTVIPVGSALSDREAIFKGLTRRNAGEAEPRYSVHIGGYADSVPVDGSCVLQPVGHRDSDGVAFAPSEDRTRHGPIDRSSARRSSPMRGMWLCEQSRDSWLVRGADRLLISRH